MLERRTAPAIGDVALGDTPRIVVPLTDREVPSRLAEAKRWADIVELRVDLFASRDPRHVADTCRQVRQHGRPVIITVRHPDEGGGSASSDAQRRSIFETVAADADAFDIEVGAAIAGDVLDVASATGTTAIASHHDFQATPADTELHAILDTCAEKGAAIAKLAATANSAGDRNRLLDLLRQRRQENTVIIAMGEHGNASRVFFPLCGSLLTYGFLDESVAPGQMPIRTLRSELARYCPSLSPELD